MKTTYENSTLAKIAHIGSKLQEVTERYEAAAKKEDELDEIDSTLSYDRSEAEEKCLDALSELAGRIDGKLDDASELFNDWQQANLAADEAERNSEEARTERARVQAEKKTIRKELLTLCIELAKA